jgi:hypothetical protein
MSVRMEATDEVKGVGLVDRTDGMRWRRGISRGARIGLLLLIAACEPQDRRPGLWLSGELVEAPIDDWSFTDEIGEIFVETRTWYGIPHSVTTVCVAHDGSLYVPSVYLEGGEFPDARHWNRNVVRDPRVRLKIGNRLYERKAVLVEDPEEWDAVFAAFGRKSPFWKQLADTPAAKRPRIVFFRMDPRDDAGAVSQGASQALDAASFRISAASDSRTKPAAMASASA